MFLVWCRKCKLRIVLSNRCPLNTNYYNSEDQSETMHNILFACNITKILDNKISIVSEGL